MKNLPPNRLKYFLLIVILIFGFFLVFKETRAFVGGEYTEPKVEEKINQEASESKKIEKKTETEASPTVPDLNIDGETFFGKNKELVMVTVFLVLTAVIIGLIIVTAVYFLRKREK